MSGESGVPFGRYRLLEEIGAGGMAAVYRAVIDGPKGFTRALVIKRILPELSQDPSFVNMLAAEARLCGLLHHPGIVQVHELGEVDGEYYLAMELVDGPDLRSILRRSKLAGSRLSAGVVCHIVSELASALAYAHALKDGEGRELSIVHRDISPSNIMLTTLGAVKLLDFGIAKAASCVQDEQTRTGAIKGKIAYMSPEQVEGRMLDRRSDIFSLGAVFYECLTLKRLFVGHSDFERMRLVREAKVTPPSSMVPDIDADLEAVLLRMLAASPDDRFASCDDVVTALAPIAHRLNGNAAALKALLAALPPAPPRPAPTVRPGRTLQTQPAHDDNEPDELPATRPTSAYGGTVTGSHGEIRASEPTRLAPPPERPTRGWALAGGLALLLCTGGVVTYRALGGPVAPRVAAGQPSEIPPAIAPIMPSAPAIPTPPAPTPTGIAPTPTETRVEPQRFVQLRVDGPARAKVLLDGRLVGELPLDLQLEPVDRARHVVVQRAGHASWVRDVAGNLSVTLTATLRRRSDSSGKNDIGIYDPFKP